MHQRLRARPYGHAVRDQRAQVLGGDVLVVEGEHGTSRGERGKVGVAALVTNDGVVHGERGGLLRRPGEDAEADAEGNRRLTGHPGELAATDHPHNRRLGHGGPG